MPARRWRDSSPAASKRPCSCGRPAAGKPTPRAINPIPPPKPGEKVELPTPRLADVQGKIEAREADLPLVIRKPQGLGQVVFVATDLDRGPIRDWSDRPLLVAAILDLPANEQAGDDDERRAELRLQRPGRAVAQRPGRAARRAPRAVLRGGPAGDRLHPLDRAGRLLPAPPPGPRHAVDVDHLSGDRRPLCRRGPTWPPIG